MCVKESCIYIQEDFYQMASKIIALYLLQYSLVYSSSASIPCLYHSFTDMRCFVGECFKNMVKSFSSKEFQINFKL